VIRNKLVFIQNNKPVFIEVMNI